MLKHTLRRSTLKVTDKFSKVLRLLIRDEAASGKFLLVGIAIALIAANSPLGDAYEGFWNQLFTISIGQWGISETLLHWVNEGLMAIFFLVAGLEIKREIVKGELHTWRAAALPVGAAIGGMFVPALVYAAINAGHAGFSGWGIPMTTDTAFAIGALALLGRRIPVSLRLFLLATVVVDDIGAITIISLFYSNDVSFTWLAVSVGILGIVALLQWLRLLRFSIFVSLGIFLWLSIHASGVDAAIAGALLGLSAPIVSRRKDKRAIAGHLERLLIPVSTFVVMPLFALANAGVKFDTGAFNTQDATLVGVGVVAGLVIGKTLGIFGAAWLVVRTRISSLPDGMQLPHIFGASMLCGIGFTLSIFIASLAFEGTALFDAAKISIFIASVISACLGLAYLRFFTKPTEE